VNTKAKIIGGGIVIVAVFLSGYVPQFLDKRRVQAELDDAQVRLSGAHRQIELDEIRRLAGKMLLEASRKNFGTAGEHSTEFFNRVRDLVDNPENASWKSSLMDLLTLRDSITSRLAQGDPSITTELQSLLEQTYKLADAQTAER
jgi:hypothetical protein